MDNENTRTAFEPKKAKMFASRLLSSLLLYGILFLGLFAPNETVGLISFGTCMILLAGFALHELFNLAHKCRLTCFPYFGLFVGVLMVASVFCALGILKRPILAEQIEFGTLIFLIPALGLCQLFYATKKLKSASIAVTLFGIIYVGVMINLMQKIRFSEKIEGEWWLLFFIVTSKMSDTGAYCVGSLFGKRKMVPNISPGKTWEGFIGAIIFSILTSVTFLYFWANQLSQLSFVVAISLGIILGLGSVVGDLVESLFKREANVKDSGSYFPGIGGILDLMDSLLFNAPLMYLYLRYGLGAL